MELIKNADGTPWLLKPGEATRFNPQTGDSTRVPGSAYFIKNKKLYRDIGTVNPYASSEIELIEQRDGFAFVKIAENTWYWFPIKKDDDGREYFISERFHTVGVNDVESRAYAEFISHIQAIKETAKVAAQREEQRLQEARLKAENEQRKSEIKNRMLELQSKIQSLSKDRKAKDLLQDMMIQTLLSEYTRLETLLKIRAL